MLLATLDALSAEGANQLVENDCALVHEVSEHQVVLVVLECKQLLDIIHL